MPTLIEGILLGLSVAAPVGPTNIELIRRGLKSGFGACIAFALGVEVALVIYLVAVFAGLSFVTEVVWFNLLLSAFGVVVLFYLGFSNIKVLFSADSFDMSAGTQDSRHFVPGIVLTLTNPAVLLFWSGIIGANVATKDFNLGMSLSLSGGILIGVSLWFVALSALLHGGRRWITPRVFKVISAVAGLVLIGFGLNFGYRIIQSFF